MHANRAKPAQNFPGRARRSVITKQFAGKLFAIIRKKLKTACGFFGTTASRVNFDCWQSKLPCSQKANAQELRAIFRLSSVRNGTSVDQVTDTLFEVILSNKFYFIK